MEKYKKKSGRNYNWDYTSSAIYFVTFCTYKHNKHFGVIQNNKIILSEIGKIVEEEVLKTFEVRKYLKLHDYVIMPNHVHILLEILLVVETPQRGVSISADNIQNSKKSINFHNPQIASKKWKSGSIGSIVNQIKSISTKRINKIHKLFGWQSRYYDEIIKDEPHYWSTKKYIQNNLKNWEKDEENI
jgi:putative transposase